MFVVCVHVPFSFLSLFEEIGSWVKLKISMVLLLSLGVELGWLAKELAGKPLSQMPWGQVFEKQKVIRPHGSTTLW